MFSLLYIDDEPDLLEIGRLFLETTGEFEVSTVESGKGALTLLAQTDFDAIVSDYQMPGMTGIELLKTVRKSNPEIPFILFTGKGREEVVIEAINNGADFYLQKGGDPQSQFAELSHKIRQAIGRKRAEKALSDSEKRLADIINFLPDATFAIDTNGTVIAWNKAIEEMTGISSPGMLGKKDHEYAIPFYGERRPILIDLILRPREEIERDYQIVSKENDALTAVTSIPRPMGRQVFLLGKASLLYNRDGAVTGAIESIRDISETKLAEKALKESEELHRSLFLASPDGIIITDTSGAITHASPRALELFGLGSAEDATGTSAIDWISDEDKERARAGIAALIAGRGSSLGQEFCVRRKDNAVFPAAINTSTMKDSEGTTTGVIAVIRDITRRKNAEIALKESEEKFRTLIEQSLDGIIIMDFSGLLLFANPKVGEIIEFDHYKDLVGKCNVFDLILPESQEQARMDLLKVQAGIDNSPASYRIITFTRKEIWIECIGRKMMFEGNAAMLLSLRDVTSRKLIEEALRKANEKLNILSSITRHDIVNELLALDAYSTFLGKKIADNPEAVELLARIRKVSRRIGNQIGFTKDYQDLGIHEPVWQDIATIAKMAAYDNIREETALDIGAVGYEVFADPMLMLVFYNIFDNAMRHGETVSRITVSFTENGTGGSLVVGDNGVGVPEDLKSRIFEKGVGKNTGFGLFLAREILAITGLGIKETGAPGTGARFEISVPPDRWRRKPEAKR